MSKKMLKLLINMVAQILGKSRDSQNVCQVMVKVYLKPNNWKSVVERLVMSSHQNCLIYFKHWLDRARRSSEMACGTIGINHRPILSVTDHWRFRVRTYMADIKLPINRHMYFNGWSRSWHLNFNGILRQVLQHTATSPPSPGNLFGPDLIWNIIN